MTSRHECKYWQYNIKYHYRHCRFCGRTQYDYGQVWKDQITLEQFVSHYSGLGGTDAMQLEKYDMTIYCGQFFEFNSYESWGMAIQVKIKDITYGPFTNLNNAMWNIDKKLQEIKDAGSRGT